MPYKEEKIGLLRNGFSELCISLVSGKQSNGSEVEYTYPLFLHHLIHELDCRVLRVPCEVIKHTD